MNREDEEGEWRRRERGRGRAEGGGRESVSLGLVPALREEKALGQRPCSTTDALKTTEAYPKNQERQQILRAFLPPKKGEEQRRQGTWTGESHPRWLLGVVRCTSVLKSINYFP